MTYHSDLERARKLIKQIGLELQQDPEFGPNIIEPLKIQGVDELGDYAVMIRAKMMTVPGEQFVIRRKAYVMIKKAFGEIGIKFAFPTVRNRDANLPIQDLLCALRVFPCRGNQYDAGTGFRTGRHQYDADPAGMPYTAITSRVCFA